MNRSAKVWFPLICLLNASLAFAWLFLFGWRYSFHLAGMYFGPGIVAIAGMLLADGLVFVLLFRRSK